MRTYKTVFCLAVLAAFLVVLPKGHAEPRNGWHLENRVPANTLGMISLEGVGSWKAQFDKTAIAGLAREPEMKAFFDPIGKALEEMLAADEGDGPLGEMSEVVRESLEHLKGLHGQVGVALLDVEMEEGVPKAVATLDFGPNIADFAEFIERMRAKLDPESETVKKFKRDGRTWWQLQEKMPITATTVDTAFVVATDAALLESVLAGEIENSLGASTDFRVLRNRVGADELAVYAYANVPAISDLVMPQFGEKERKIANALGLDTVKAIAYGMAFRGDGFMDSLIVHAPDADHGLVTLMTMPAFQPRALRQVPANAFVYEEGSVNYNELLPNLRRMLTDVDEEVMGKIDGWLKEASDAVGVDLENDIFGGLAGGVAAYMAMPATGGLYPEYVGMYQVSDPASYERVFAQFARGLAGTLSEKGALKASTRELEYRGRTLHLFEMQAARGNDVIPFTPTWAMLDDWLVFTLVPHAMKEVILRADDPTTGVGLAGQEDFRSLQDVLPEGTGAMAYVDLQAVFSLLYDTAVPLLQTAVKPNMLAGLMPGSGGRGPRGPGPRGPGPGGMEEPPALPFPLDWAQLPAARTVRPYLRSFGIFSTWNKDGISMQMHGPLPLVGAMVPLSMAAGFLFMGRMSTTSVGHVRADSLVPPMPPQPLGNPGGRRVGPRVPARPLTMEQTLAQAKARELSSYVRAFLLAEKRLPATLQELVTENVLATLPKDPWGNAYVLRVTERKAHRFQIVSSGPDGTIGTADDVVVGR